MKKNLLLGSLALFLFSAAIIIFQISCSQQAPAQTSTSNCIGPQPKFQFKANGILYVCDALFDSRVGWYGDWLATDGTRYIVGAEIPSVGNDLSGGKSVSPTNAVTINLPLPNGVPTLAPIVVQNSGFLDCHIPGISGIFGNGNYTINFSRISSDGYADGTFSATIWQTSAPSQTVSITDGVFSNLPVL